MTHKFLLLTLFINFSCKAVISNTVSSTSSLIASSTEPTKEAQNSGNVESQINPQIYSMQIHSNISNRFATTLVTSKVRNLKEVAAETTFSVILPENAFISAFEMEIDGKIYKAYVKEKEEAKQIYQEAVSRGQSAAHVELNARDSKTFTVSVNIEPESKTIFRLTYEELLQRQNGQYELIINIHPGQTVEDLGVQVYINESRPLTFVKTPSLRSGNEISKNEDKLNPAADIEIINATSANVKFNPDIKQQKKFTELLGKSKENGLAGQFVVQYDVERDPQGGEVLVRDGYFVHFFAPSELEPLPKHVVFVLDHSGSMHGRKIEQLTEAMQNILSELNPHADLFNIVRFSEVASVWNIFENKFSTVNVPRQYGSLEPHLRELNLPQAVEATKENVEKAKDVIKEHDDLGMTNIIAGLEVGLFLTKRTQEKTPNKYQPMIIFLTDGFPNEGISSTDQITNTVTKLNAGTNRAPIFSLSFGTGADKEFLRKLSAQNLGFSKHIYESSDASLQLQDFYKKISSPLLSNVTFKYVDGVTEVTKTHYPILFRGSEFVVAGKTSDDPNILLHVVGLCTAGRVTFNATRSEPVSSLERLWAYLTVKQILNQRETATNKTELTKKALDLALKYSFVTSVSSLVVVKPNKTDSVDTKDASSGSERHPGFGVAMPRSALALPRAPPFSGHRRYLAMPLHNIGYSAMLGPPGYPGASNPVSFDASSNFYNRMSGPTFRPLLVPIPHTTRRPYLLHTTTIRSQDLQSNLTAPQWLETIRTNNDTITTPQGTFKLGQHGDVTFYPYCPKTPTNSTGFCTLIFDCPAVLSALTDHTVYLEYFCPLNEYAGVCCPKKPSN